MADEADYERRKQQWLGAGLDVMEVDHNWCKSIYTKDPNDNLVEFCLTTGSFSEEDRKTALAELETKAPNFSKPPASMQVHKAEKADA